MDNTLLKAQLTTLQADHDALEERYKSLFIFSSKLTLTKLALDQRVAGLERENGEAGRRHQQLVSWLQPMCEEVSALENSEP